MSAELECPNCQTDEHLSGMPAGDVIRLTCGACGLSWDRDPGPTCRDCGTREDVQTVTQPFIQKSRGTQLSIVGLQVVYLCYACFGADEDVREYRHIPPGQHPAK
ncbi:MAG: hypothetical protein AB7L13_24780 [Acidimicrobiia bacterium]